MTKTKLSDLIDLNDYQIALLVDSELFRGKEFAENANNKFFLELQSITDGIGKIDEPMQTDISNTISKMNYALEQIKIHLNDKDRTPKFLYHESFCQNRAKLKSILQDIENFETDD